MGTMNSSTYANLSPCSAYRRATTSREGSESISKSFQISYCRVFCICESRWLAKQVRRAS